MDDTHDALLLTLIAAAAESIEGLIGGRLCEQSVRMTFDRFPSVLPIYPVRSIDAFVYDDVNGDTQTMGDYHASLNGIRPQISPATVWPAAQDKPGSVRIDATLGFDAVPHALQMAILLRVKEMFAQRGESIPGGSGMAALSPITVASLVAPYKRVAL